MSAHRAAWAVIIVLAGFTAASAVACSRSPIAPSTVVAGVVGGAATTGGAQHTGDGNTPFRLTQAGWQCLNVPGHGVHCLDPHGEIGSSVHIQVKVFDTADPSSDSATFQGTESLVRADHYRGQPCLPGHGEYLLLPFGYYACHHFDF